MPYPPGMLSHRAHDAACLLKRWQSLAKRMRWQLSVVHEAHGWPVFCIRSRPDTRKPVYLSSGVHGDEPGSAWGLLEWAESRRDRLRNVPLLMFPVFNPAGLSANTRADGDGLDLNRAFHDEAHPHIRGWLEATAGVNFQIAACLHEDYDGQGCYCYELTTGKPLADSLLECCAPVLPREPRSNIDGRRATRGVIRRRYPPLNLPGKPEAIALYVRNRCPSLTFETPSEFALTDRIAAHAAFLDGLLDFCGY